jgi:threonine synthase
MQYYSLKKQSALVDFKTAAITGQAPDKGLYFPESITPLSADFFKNLIARLDNTAVPSGQVEI